jgi:hypothetical protein
MVMIGSVKEAIVEAIKALPDDCTFADISEEISTWAHIFKGMYEIEKGDVHTMDKPMDEMDILTKKLFNLDLRNAG